MKKQVLALILSFLFFCLGFYHLKFREVFLVKVGTTHFFSPATVSMLSYLIPALNILAATLLWVRGVVRLPALLLFFLSAGYLYYIVMNYMKLDTSCNCTNLFGTIGLKWQALLFSVCALMSVYLFFVRERNAAS